MKLFARSLGLILILWLAPTAHAMNTTEDEEKTRSSSGSSLPSNSPPGSRRNSEDAKQTTTQKRVKKNPTEELLARMQAVDRSAKEAIGRAQTMNNRTDYFIRRIQTVNECADRIIERTRTIDKSTDDHTQRINEINKSWKDYALEVEASRSEGRLPRDQATLNAHKEVMQQKYPEVSADMIGHLMIGEALAKKNHARLQEEARTQMAGKTYRQSLEKVQTVEVMDDANQTRLGAVFGLTPDRAIIITPNGDRFHYDMKDQTKLDLSVLEWMGVGVYEFTADYGTWFKDGKEAYPLARNVRPIIAEK